MFKYKFKLNTTDACVRKTSNELITAMANDSSTAAGGLCVNCQECPLQCDKAKVAIENAENSNLL